MPKEESKMFRPGSKADLFLQLAKPDKDGFSRKVYIKEFKGKYKKIYFTGNGGSWCRDDGSLGERFNIERHKEGVKIDYIRLHGYNNLPIKKTMPTKIHDEIIKGRCSVLATSQVEVDHRNGRRDDPRLNDPARVKLGDFQPLSKGANNAKRQHCKECRETGKRFDAKRLGYRVSQTKGNGIYRGTCVGCYWYGPKEFNRIVSEQFAKAVKGT